MCERGNDMALLSFPVTCWQCVIPLTHELSWECSCVSLLAAADHTLAVLETGPGSCRSHDMRWSPLLGQQISMSLAVNKTKVVEPGTLLISWPLHDVTETTLPQLLLIFASNQIIQMHVLKPTSGKQKIQTILESNFYYSGFFKIRLSL